MKDASAALARAYEQAIYTAELPAGRVLLRIHAPASGPVSDRSFAIITAWNPGTRRPSISENRGANARLAAALRREGWSTYPASGRSEDGGHEEPSFAVMDIEPERALALARSFGQAAVLYWNGTEARLLWSDPA